MTTRKQEVDFASELFSNTLDEAVAWIGRNLTPDEVFTEDALAESIRDNQDMAEVYSVHDIQAYVRQNYSVDDVYNHDDLVAWAKSQGYVYQD